MDALPVRRRLPHDVPSWIPDGSTFFITICTRDRNRAVLTEATVARIVRDCTAFQVQRGQWWVELLLIMPDHLHGLIAFGGGVGMKQSIARWKSFVAKKAGIAWQRDFFDHRLRDRRSVAQRWNYILQNPVRKGLVPDAEQWPWVWTAKDFCQRKE